MKNCLLNLCEALKGNYAGDEIDRLNKTYLGKVKFYPNFIDCYFPQGLTHPPATFTY